MANILAISSQVVRGAIGNSIAAFTLQRMGHTVWQIPTILLSNHPGHGTYSGYATAPDDLQTLWDGFKAHNWHHQVDAILTGYIPNAELVQLAGTLVQDVRQARPDAKHLCDPVIGDLPGGRYINESAAIAIRETLVPHADVITPNCFELGWLAGTPPPENAETAREAARTVGCANTITTSTPGKTSDTIENIVLTPNLEVACSTEMIPAVPKGTGDLFAAAVLGHWAHTGDLVEAAARATTIVQSVLHASAGHDALQVVAAQDTWMNVDACPVRELKA